MDIEIKNFNERFLLNTSSVRLEKKEGKNR